MEKVISETRLEGGVGINHVNTYGGGGSFPGKGMSQHLEVVACPAHQRKGAEASVAGGGWARRGGRGMRSDNLGHVVMGALRPQ